MECRCLMARFLPALAFVAAILTQATVIDARARRPTPKPRPDPSCSTGILGARSVCCARKCGACGGSRCNKRPGGGKMCCSGPILADKKSCNHQGPPCVVKTKPRLRNNKGIAPAASFVPAEVSTATDQRENVVTPPPDGSTTWGWQRGGTSAGFTILAIAILAVVWKSAGPPKAKCSRRRSTLLAVVVSSFVPVVFVMVQLHVPSGTGFGAGNAAATEAPGAGEVDAVATDDPVDWAKRIDIFIVFHFS